MRSERDSRICLSCLPSLETIPHGFATCRERPFPLKSADSPRIGSRLTVPRRLPMKRVTKSRVLTACAILAVLAAMPALAQLKATIENVRDIPFTTVPNLLKLPPGENLGEI